MRTARPPVAPPPPLREPSPMWTPRPGSPQPGCGHGTEAMVSSLACNSVVVKRRRTLCSSCRGSPSASPQPVSHLPPHQLLQWFWGSGWDGVVHVAPSHCPSPELSLWGAVSRRGCSDLTEQEAPEPSTPQAVPPCSPHHLDTCMCEYVCTCGCVTARWGLCMATCESIYVCEHTCVACDCVYVNMYM